MTRAADAFRENVILSDSIQAADPQLVLVFEALDERTDLNRIAQTLDLEILIEVESAIDPDEEVELASQNAKDPQITACMHAICLNQAAMARILTAWNSWRRNGSIPRGMGPLAELFSHLSDVRPWGPEDRLRSIDWDEYFAGRIPGAVHVVEIELWYRASSADRFAAVQNVSQLIEQAGGRFIAASEQANIGYSAVKCEVPDEVLRALASGDFDDIKLIKSADVLFLKVQGQGPLQHAADQDPAVLIGDLPTGPARVLIVDGVPVSNHERLAGRIQVVDPDDLAQASEATVGQRRHGTWMASVVVWGDIAANEPPLARPVIVRPVIVPSSTSIDSVEEFAADVFVPDVMRRVFLEHFPDGIDPGLTIVNISLGDPAVPFDSIMSSWARILDWLSFQYGVLIVVSAGNHRTLPLASIDSSSLLALAGTERSAAVHAAQHDDWAGRRLLSPAESINSITVGALHDDATNAAPVGYVFDPHDGLAAASPISGLGAGHRRAVKPDVAASGGRMMFTQPPNPVNEISASDSTRHGVRVASATVGKEVQIGGTSPAAALISRKLSDLVDLAEEIAGPGLSRHERAVAAKAMLVHGARHPAEIDSGDLPLRHAIGYGAIERNLADGCASNEATVLYLGELGALEEQELLFPLPDGLGTRDIKRVTATLAWLSPVNWRHRQYRRAQLAFAKPTGLTVLPGSVDVADGEAKRGSSTLKHQTWEVDRAIASGYGDSFSLRVKCFEQAGGLQGQHVPYAVVMSLWVAPTVGIDVYSQVAAQIQPRVSVRPGN